MKRHGAASSSNIARTGFLAEALMNYLARLGWAYGDEEIFSASDLVAKFDIGNVGKSPAIFDMDKLLWLNGHYMKTIDPADIAARLAPFIEKLGYPVDDRERLLKIVLLLRDRAKTLKEMAQQAEFFFSSEISYEEKSRQKYLGPESKAVLERFLTDFNRLAVLDEAGQRQIVEGIAKDLGKKMVDVIQPVRVALSGRHVTPGIFEVIEILGKKTVQERVARALSSIA